MPTTFSLCDATSEAAKILAAQMKLNHQDLDKLGVKIGIVLAYNEDDSAVKHAGYPALAKIKVVPLKDRISKNYDAELLIDDTQWRDLSFKQKNACMDHELEHLRLVVKEDEDTGVEQIQLDDIGRPRLKCVNADIPPSDGWTDVISRHGEDAIEFYNLRRAHAAAVAALTKEN